MRDADGDAVSLTFSITVNEPAPGDNQQHDLLPTFSSASVSDRNFTVGQSVGTVTLPAATGGNAPLTYSLSPALPNGLTFNRQHPDHHRRTHGGAGTPRSTPTRCGTRTATVGG